MRKVIGKFFPLLIIPFIAYLLIKVIRKTMRIKYFHRETIDQLMKEGKGYIIAFWHGRLFMMPYSYQGKKITILISKHKDGEYIARTMSLFGFDSTRGSTTKGAVSALKDILRKANRGYDIAFTPDGPRGPKYKVQMGVIEVARLTGYPIIPVSFSASRKKIFNSWDSFLFPYPFSQGVFYYGKPIFVSRDSNDELLDRKRLELEKSLNKITEEVDKIFIH